MKYKHPESVLVVVYCANTKRVLMLQRKDDQDFWQSVSGSLEVGETPAQAAKREVFEELQLDISTLPYKLKDCHYEVDFEIFAQFRERYAPNVTHCHEYWFTLPLAEECSVVLTEHSAYRWVEAETAVKMTKSWNNAQAIEKFVIHQPIEN
ncbi:dihydroneopterin triphosphate pyrophosphatase [Gallibacterium salpingitidis]|uniref:Dihydroneopterin triphosphate pyrophosphatase n=1 Tax=Gallibacterium salpingitidis TaxID=505341 RepID=A0AB36E1V1_9PAST|nr:dihydroneopterin triphosphate diphosphatase [Gallibacterium salpingitidis]OBX09735.1 dihydroneopterin triphosphate pyrophosphatase [Gallibacterium salpingitidis]